MLAYAVLLLPFAVVRRFRSRPQQLLSWALLILGSLGIAGCGAGGYFSRSEQTYVITVTGTSGNLTHTTTATLTVE
jgi:hypothetical protein